MSFTAIILAGGDPVPSALAALLPRADLVIAADSGFDLAPLLDLKVDLLIGDLDSLDPGTDLSATRVERHPTDKNHSDLELAFAAATAREADDVIVVGGGGGRLDHLLVNASVIAGNREGSVTWFTGDEIAYVVTRTRIIPGTIGDLVTLLAFGGDAHGVVTKGLRYALDRETVPFGSARGLSNVLSRPEAEVSLDSGTLLAIHVPASGNSS